VAASLDELWRQVAETPDEVSARLVLADALIEAGDPRGELIALQCGGADANVIVDRDHADNVAERVNDLVAAHWDAWLGDAALVIHRHGAKFEGGMLAAIEVGSEDPVPEGVWDRAGGHRELCTLQRVRPRKIKPGHYGRFLAGLERDPPWVEIRQGTVAAVRARRKRWGVRVVRWSGVCEPEAPDAELALLSEVAPELEQLELAPLWVARELAAAFLAIVARLPMMFRGLQRVRIEGIRSSLRDLGEWQHRELARHAFVELVD
jgi:uncharacterized protein (TIGR02996 family)